MTRSRERLNPKSWRLAWALSLLLLLPLTANATEDNPTAPASENSAGEAPVTEEAGVEIVFIPPAIGAPGGRVGAGTRTTGQAQNGSLVLLAPPGGGYSLSDAPTLHWWLAEPHQGRLRITLQAVGAGRPLLEFEEEAESEAGLQSLALADLGLRLKAETIYRWSVALESGGNWRAPVESYLEVRRLGGQTPDSNDSGALGRGGYWYDALATAIARDLDWRSLLRTPGVTLR